VTESCEENVNTISHDEYAGVGLLAVSISQYTPSKLMFREFVTPPEYQI